MYEKAVALFCYLNNFLKSNEKIKQDIIVNTIEEEKKKLREISNLPFIEESEIYKLRKNFIENPDIPLVYYTKDKVIDDINNKKQSLREKIDFLCICNPQVIKEKFLSAKRLDKFRVQIMWGLKPFIIYCVNINHNNTKFINPCMKLHPMFTMDYVLQSKYGYLDYTFDNGKISALSDIQNKILRIVDFRTNKDIVLPTILRLAETNFRLDSNSIYYLYNKRDTMKIENDKIFLNVLKAPYYYDVLKYLNNIKLFNSTRFNNDFKIIYKNLDILEKYKMINLSLEEKLFLLFGNELKNSYTYNLLNAYQKYQIMWIKKHLNIFNCNTQVELRLNIYNSIDPLIKKYGIPLLKNLLNKVRNINIILNNKISNDYLQYCLCGRPYFKEQLYITDDELQEIFNRNDDELKESIIKHILTLDKYPKELKIYLNNNKEKILKEM